MPRVHGIDIVPRRGRGLCRHRASIVGDGVDTTVRDFEANSAGAFPSHLADDDVYACSTSLSLDITVNGLDDSHDGERNREITSAEAPPESNISGNASDGTLPSASLVATTDTTIINASIVQSASTKESRATSFIRPQPRESLDFMDFGSHSFSVQQISHKSSPTCNLNDLHIDSRGPSLEATDEFHQITVTNITTQSLTVQSREIKGGTVNLVEHTECKEEINTLEASNPITESGNLHNIDGTTALTDVHIPRNPASTEVVNENKEQLSLPTRDQGPTTTITDIDDSLNVSNSQWFIRRCSAACLQMETSLSPLELAMKTLHAIRCITYDDQFEEQLQHELFALLKNGKRRDLEYVFDVSERASELRDDTKLNDESLREAASSATANDVANDELEASSDNYHDDEIDGHNELATQPPEILPKTSHPQLFNQMEQEHYDQMDWLSTSRSTSSVQSHTTVPHSRRKKRHSNGNGVILQDEMKSSCASTYENTPSREDAKNQADFRTNADDLDMQDDDIWSFLPNIQSTDEMKEDEELPTRRITRSMNVENSDETDNSQPCHESSSQCAGDDIADDNVIEGTETQVIDLNTQVSEVRMKCTDNEHVDSQNSGTNNIQLLNEDQNNEKCIGSSYEDGEVYSMVKMRERSEGKGVVRIIFTGLTPTHKHMQVSRYIQPCVIRLSFTADIVSTSLRPR